MSLEMRLMVGGVLMASLIGLVLMQMHRAAGIGWLTTEQLMARGEKGLSFERHFAMPFDLVVIPAVVLLAVLLCGKEWSIAGSNWMAVVAIVVTIALVVFWLKLPGKEAHKDYIVGILHGLYVFLALWVMLMVFIKTSQPNPVLLMVLGLIVPMFLFLGQHLYLGLINWNGEATTYGSQPLKDIVPWAVIIAVSSVVWWRIWMLIPSAFWRELQ